MPSMAHFQEIYNRPTPNTSFIDGDESNNDLNISKLSKMSAMNGEEEEDETKEAKDRDCACLIF